jgi:hypothetical protein
MDERTLWERRRSLTWHVLDTGEALLMVSAAVFPHSPWIGGCHVSVYLFAAAGNGPGGGLLILIGLFIAFGIRVLFKEFRRKGWRP